MTVYAITDTKKGRTGIAPTSSYYPKCEIMDKYVIRNSEDSEDVTAPIGTYMI